MPASSDIFTVDGILDFSGGVDSLKAPTVATPQNPNGLGRNMLAWLINGTVRDGGVTQRPGMLNRGMIGTAAQQAAQILTSGLFQGAVVYEPDDGNPYHIVLIGGHVLKVDPDDPASAVDLSAQFNLFHPAAEPYAYFCQGENYLIIQAGDFGKGGTPNPPTTDAAGNTLPLFWDGTTLRRSKGITNTAVGPGTPGVNEIPAATAMDYYMNRIWYAQLRTYSAGDIVGGNSGTAAAHFRDAILNVTENPLVVGGDGFTVPTNAGNIRALKHSANLDSQLGQGNLFVFTRKAVYSLTVPITRANWIAANTNNQPLQTVVQIANGAVNDRGVVPLNGDLFYQSLEPSIRSLISALRYVGQWNNPPLSANEQRILDFTDRALLHFASGTVFDNRLLQTALPQQASRGVVHSAILPLDFAPLSELGQSLQPAWEGNYEGIRTLQLLTEDFGGLERCFAYALSDDNTIELWELTTAERFEAGDKRVQWVIEFPALNGGKEFDLKRMVSGELWVDKLYGTVRFKVEWRPDGDPCWKLWHEWDRCVARTSCENAVNPVCYPIEVGREGYQSTMTLPIPPRQCTSYTGRPADIGYQFQVRLTIKGWCRVRGFLLHLQPVERKLYQGIVC